MMLNRARQAEHHHLRFGAFGRARSGAEIRSRDMEAAYRVRHNNRITLPAHNVVADDEWTGRISSARRAWLSCPKAPRSKDERHSEEGRQTATSGRRADTALAGAGKFERN